MRNVGFQGALPNVSEIVCLLLFFMSMITHKTHILLFLGLSKIKKQHNLLCIEILMSTFLSSLFLVWGVL